MESLAATGQLDAYCNLAILIFAKIINFLADCQEPGRSSITEVEAVNSLWTELQAWRDHRLKEALPLFRSGKSKRQPFETIIFTHSSSSKSVHKSYQTEQSLTKLPVCGNTFYHTGSILLLRTGQVRPGVAEKTSDRVCVFTQHLSCIHTHLHSLTQYGMPKSSVGSPHQTRHSRWGLRLPLADDEHR